MLLQPLRTSLQLSEINRLPEGGEPCKSKLRRDCVVTRSGTTLNVQRVERVALGADLDLAVVLQHPARQVAGDRCEHMIGLYRG